MSLNAPTNNPGGRLLNFLAHSKQAAEEASYTPIIDVWAEYFEVTADIDTAFLTRLGVITGLTGEIRVGLASLPEDVKRYLAIGSFNPTLKIVDDAMSGSIREITLPIKRFIDPIDAGHLAHLSHVRNILDTVTVQLPDAAILDQIRQLARDIADLIDADSTLPRELRLLLRDFVDNIDRSIRDFRIGGTAELAAIRERLAGQYLLSAPLRRELGSRPNLQNKIMAILTATSFTLSLFNTAVDASDNINSLGQSLSVPISIEAPASAEFPTAPSESS